MKKTITVDLEHKTIDIHIENLLITDATNLSTIVLDIADNVRHTLLMSGRHEHLAETMSAKILGIEASQETLPEDP